MPFVYCFHSTQEAQNHLTSGTPNTEVDVMSAAAAFGSTRIRTLQAVYVQGKSVASTSLTALSFRIKVWTTIPSGNGAVVSTTAVDNRAPVAESVVIVGPGGGAIPSPGSGGPVIVGGFGCLASEPGGWTALDEDGRVQVTPIGGQKSIDLFAVSGLPRMPYEFSGEILET